MQTVWACIKTLKGKEFGEASTTLRTKIQHGLSSGIEKGFTSDMRIKYNNRYFDIEAIINDDEMNKTLTIHAKERVQMKPSVCMEELLAQLRHMGEKGDKIKEQAEMEGAKNHAASHQGKVIPIGPHTKHARDHVEIEKIDDGMIVATVKSIYMLFLKPGHLSDIQKQRNGCKGKVSAKEEM
ncbi:head-tail adaptor protein [Paenibacillus larvae]|nr:head-tail adaptor protein [Paenibacillus larvae]MDT2276122.1 head-tail adaptor protein [Paenibacillus larvae]